MSTPEPTRNPPTPEAMDANPVVPCSPGFHPGVGVEPARSLATDIKPTGDDGHEAQSQRGATSLEWTLLVAAIALPGYFILSSALNLLIAYYQMMTELNSLPFP